MVLFIANISIDRIALRCLSACICALFFLVAFGVFAPTAKAQVTSQYNDIPATAVNIPDNGCAATGTSLVRTFNVPTTYTVGDVNLGILIAHPWRADLRITLSHGIKTVTLTDASGNDTDNLNVTFDDEATGGAIGAHTVNDPLTPIYNSTKNPANPLSAFDGDPAAGLWTLTICDQANADTGTYSQATLSVSTPTPGNDLSLTKTVSNAAPTSGGTTDYTLTVTNAATSVATANGVVVRDILPVGTTFNSVVSGTGTYTSATGVWAVGSIPVGTSRSIVIRVNVTASAATPVQNIAEITAASITDIDSTPNNGVTTEDDYAAVNFTVAGTRIAGTAPTLTCPNGSSVFDWDTTAPTWTAGSTNNSYALAGVGNINYALANPGAWLFRPDIRRLGRVVVTWRAGTTRCPRTWPRCT